MTKLSLFALLLLGVLVTSAPGEEVLDEYRVWKHRVSIKQLETVIADGLEDVEEVTILSVHEVMRTVMFFGMSIRTSDKQEYKFPNCILDTSDATGRGTVECAKSGGAVLDEIEIDFEELSPRRRFKGRKS